MSIYLADTAAQNALSLSGYAPVYQAAATAYNYPANVLAAQGFVESSYNPNAYNPSGATGIAQFMPSTAAQYGVNPANPVSSIYGQAQYDANLLAQNGGNMSAALEQYSGNTPGYANNVLGVAGVSAPASTSTSSPYQQIINNATGAFSVIPAGAPVPTGYSAMGNTKASYTNAVNQQAANAQASCGFSPSCWGNYFMTALKTDALSIFLFFFAILLVGFGIYKLSGAKAPSVVPVPV